MARPKTSERRAAAIAAFEAAKQEVAELEAKEAARIGKVALRAGLADLDLSDATLLAEFQAMAGRFRDGTAKPARPHARPAPADNPDAGTSAEGSP